MSDKEQPWERVLADARIKKHVYSATFLSTRSISIVDQQTRCFNLCYALSASGEVKKKSHVGIIGSGVSGMTCAVALAMLRDCLVYVFEQDNTVLRKFREAAFRYIHPDLNPGDTLYRYQPHKKTKFPFMNWSGNYAPLVAEEIARKLDHYRAVSNIALFLNEGVVDFKLRGRWVKILLTENRLLTFDTVIIASGFGNEKRAISTSDFSYWHSGNPHSYQPPQLRSRGRKKERVLISGNGDSGVIELAHLLIRDFNHRDIFTYLPSNDVPLLSDHFFDGVRALRFRDIEEGNENFPEFPGPISWYWGVRELLEDNPKLTLSDLSSPAHYPHLLNIYKSIDCHLSSFERSSAIGSPLVVEMEKCLDPLLDKLASYEIAELVANYRLERIFTPAIRDQFRQDFLVTMIGKGPTIYSRRQAPLNWFLLRVLEKYGRFKYRSAKLSEDQRPRMEQGGIRVVLEGKRPTVAFFDRIIVRHGPDYEVLGYKNDIKDTQSKYKRTHDPVFADVAFFRTQRWKKAVRTPTIIHDDGDQGFTFGNPDKFLLALSEFGLHRKAGKLYREAKKAKRSLDAVNQMAKLLSAIYEKVGTSHNKAVHQTRARTARDRRR